MPNRDIVFTLKFKNLAGQVIRKFGAQLKGMGVKSAIAGKGLDKLARKFRKLGDATLKASRKIRSAGAAIREAGTNIALSVGAPIAAAVAISVKAFANFDLAMKGVQKTVDASPEQLEELGRGFIEMSNNISTSAVELGRIGQIAGQLGVAVDDIGDFTRVIAEFGVATEVSTEEAAFSLARLATIMQLPTAQTRNLASSMVALGNNFAANEPEIISMSLRIAKAGKVVGLTAGEVFGFSTALASVGVNAQAGGTAISKAFIKINKSVNQGGAELEEFARTAGVSVNEFSDLFRNDAAKAFELFIKGLEQTRRSGGDVLKTLEDLGLQEIRTQQAILGLALASDTLTGALSLGNKAFEEGTALSKEATIFFSALSERMKVVRNRFIEVARSLGESFAPQIDMIVNKLLEFGTKLQDFAKRVGDLSNAQKELILKILAFGIALGPVLVILGSFVLIIGSTIAAFGQFIKVFSLVRKAMAVLQIGLLFTNPIGLAILAIGLIVAALVKFRNEVFTVGEKTFRLRDLILGAWDTIRDAVVAKSIQIKEAALGIWDDITEKIAIVATGVVSLWNDAVLSMQLLFSGLAEKLGPIWDRVKKVITDAFAGLATVIQPDMDTLKSSIKALANSIIKAFMIVKVTVFSIFDTLFLVMDNTVKAIVDLFINARDALALLKKKDFSGAVDALFGTVTNPFEGVVEKGKELVDDIKAIVDGANDPLGTAWEVVAENSAVRFNNRITEVVAKDKSLRKTMEKKGEEIIDDFKKVGPELADTFNKLFIEGMENALSNYSKTATDVAQLTEDAFKNAFDKIEEGLLDFIETGKFNFKDFAQSIMREFNKIAIKSILGDISLKLQGKDASEGGFLAQIGNLFKGKGSAGDIPGAGGAFGVAGGLIGPAEAGFGEAGGLIGPAEAPAKGIIDAVTSGTMQIGEFFKTNGTKFVEGLGAMGSFFMDGLADLGGLISDLFSSIADLFSSGSDILGGVLDVVAAAAAEGGISDTLSKGVKVPVGAFAYAKKFAQGGVTSGSDRIPALLSRNEAVVPLSRNRAIPIEGGPDGGTTNITFNIQTNDAESFKQSRSQMLARLGSAVAIARRRTQ